MNLEQLQEFKKKLKRRFGLSKKHCPILSASWKSNLQKLSSRTFLLLSFFGKEWRAPTALIWTVFAPDGTAPAGRSCIQSCTLTWPPEIVNGNSAGKTLSASHVILFLLFLLSYLSDLFTKMSMKRPLQRASRLNFYSFLIITFALFI